MKFNLVVVLFVLSSLFWGSESVCAQTWSFGFEDADFTTAGGNALVFDQTFDGVANSASLIDNTYISATTNDFLYGGDYTVATGFDAQEGNNFAMLATSNGCFGVDGSAIGLVGGQEYTVSFYIAAPLIRRFWKRIFQSRPHSRLQMDQLEIFSERMNRDWHFLHQILRRHPIHSVIQDLHRLQRPPMTKLH